VYIQNRCAHVILENKTPQELWSGHKPNIAYLRIFGSVAYGKVSDPKRTKLDDKSKKYIFNGYDKKSKVYKLYDPIEKKSVVNRDIEVNEEARWDWNQQEELMIGEIKLLIRDDGASSLRSSDEDSSSRSSEDEQEPMDLRFRDLRDLYETTGEVHLVSLLVDAEIISFEKAAQDTKWKAAMDEEIKTIEKNET
jgi:hypothetical protein